jgi:tetratricopeptide (TPR) repeat protein
MHVRIIDGRPIATLKLDGTDVPLLLDSGAFISIVSAAAAAQLKLATVPMPRGWRIEGTTGRIDVRLARVGRVGLLGTELQNVEFLVGGNELNAGAMGVIGRNLLAIGDTEYDLAHGVVRLSFPKGECTKTNFAYWAGSAPVVVVPLEQGSDDSEIRIPVALNGVAAKAVMDTGAAVTSITLAAARRAGIEERDMVLVGRSGGHGVGRSNVWLGTLKAFEIGGEKVANSEVAINDNDTSDRDLLVGLDYFLSHRIYVSRLQRQVYITWNGGPIFVKGRVKPGEYDSRYAAVPKDLAQDDADALARRGAAALAAGNLPAALADLNRACELAPGSAEHFFVRARVHRAMRSREAELADLDAALRLDPGLALARIRRATLREFASDRPGAQADLAHLDTTLPPSSNVRSDMGNTYARLAQAPEALRQYELWVASHPRDAGLASVLNSRCWMRTRLAIDLPLALQDCKDAVAGDEGAAQHHDSLGWAYLRLGEPAKAKGAFDAALKLQELPWSLYGRGLANLRLNDTAAGERDLAAARKLRAKIDDEVLKEGFEFAEALARSRAAGS